jgi:hypothetical protein
MGEKRNSMDLTTQAVTTTESAPVSETPVVATESSESVASETTTEATQKTSQTPVIDGSAPEGDSKAVRELKEQRRRRQEAERIAQEKIEEAAYLRGQLEAQNRTGGTQTRTTQTQETVAPVEPKLENFESYDAFEAAKGRYYVDLAKHEMRQEYTQTVQRSTVQKQDEVFAARIAEAIKTDPDFSDIARSPSFKSTPMSPAEFSVIKDSEVAPKILFYLYNNPDEATRISRLNPFTAAKEIGRIEDRILTPPKAEPTKKISDAPPPIKTVSSERATVDEDLTKVSMAEFARRRMGKA